MLPCSEKQREKFLNKYPLRTTGRAEDRVLQVSLNNAENSVSILSPLGETKKKKLVLTQAGPQFLRVSL